MKRYPLNEVHYYSNFQEMLDGLERSFGSQTAVTCYSRRGEAAVYSYHDLCRDAAAFRNALARGGLSGKHVAIAGENSYSWLVAYLGIITGGGVAVCIDIEQPDEIVREMIRLADCEAVFASSALVPVVRSLVEQGEVRELFSLDRGQAPIPGFEEFCSRAQDGKAFSAALKGEQPASIIYTSGTTVVSKPVVLSHRAILTNVSDALAMISPPPKTFSSLPFYHAYGMTCSVLAGLIGGLGVCINGNLKTMMRDMLAFKPGSIVVVPLLAESIHKMIWAGIEKAGQRKAVSSLLKRYRILGRPDFLRRRLQKLVRIKQFENLEMLLCGGAYLLKEVADDLTDFGISVIQGYGITECSPLVAVNRYPDSSAVGEVLPHMELKIEDGEILVRGASLMDGYYNQPELTREAMEDGWFRTGDLGELNREGKLIVTGRKKNLIVLKNGKKISAEEIEGYFAGIPLVREIVAYGATNGSSTDDVKVAVMVYPDPEETKGMTSYEILDILQQEVDVLNAQLPTYKQIQMINLREREFEKTSSQKIKRQIV